MTTEFSLTDATDAELLARTAQLARAESEATASLIAALTEVDARRLYLTEGCSSLFVYATQVLHLSESAAYKRIEAARAARRFPLVLERLAAGDLHLAAVCLLAPHLTHENCRDLLDAARHRSKRHVEELVARIHPREDVVTLVRKVPDPPVRPNPARVNDNAGELLSPRPYANVAASDSPDSIAAAPQLPAACAASSAFRSRTVVAPLAPERFRLQVTIEGTTRTKLRRAQDLLRHSIPDGDVAQVLDRALTLLVAQLERTKAAAAERPRSRTAASEPATAACAARSRHIPAAVKREVWRRDGGQCAFVGNPGRCQERGFLEYHHLVPYAGGGPPTAANIALRCRAHNAHDALHDFPREV